MWGEIDPPAARPRPAAYARRVTREPPQSTRLDPETITFPGPHKPQTSPPHNTDTQVRVASCTLKPLTSRLLTKTHTLCVCVCVCVCVSQVVSPGVKAMLEAVALSGSQVKSQQVGDADLTLDQRRQELLVQYKSRPLVFLERYQVGTSLGGQGGLDDASDLVRWTFGIETQCLAPCSALRVRCPCRYRRPVCL